MLVTVPIPWEPGNSRIGLLQDALSTLWRRRVHSVSNDLDSSGSAGPRQRRHPDQKTKLHLGPAGLHAGAPRVDKPKTLAASSLFAQPRGAGRLAQLSHGVRLW